MFTRGAARRGDGLGDGAGAGVDVLDGARVLGHRCDNPLCQWIGPGSCRGVVAAGQAAGVGAAAADHRRPLADPRGTRGRPRELRDLGRRDSAQVAVDLGAVWARLSDHARRADRWRRPDRGAGLGRALHNLLERDRMFTERLVEETNRLSLPAVHVESGMSEDELTAVVAEVLGF